MQQAAISLLNYDSRRVQSAGQKNGQTNINSRTRRTERYDSTSILNSSFPPPTYATIPRLSSPRPSHATYYRRIRRQPCQRASDASRTANRSAVYLLAGKSSSYTVKATGQQHHDTCRTQYGVVINYAKDTPIGDVGKRNGRHYSTRW